MFRRGVALFALLTAVAGLSTIGPSAPRAAAVPVADNNTTYAAFGRVFPDPQGCLKGQAGASPWAKGNVCTVQFLGYDETIAGLRYLQQRFPRYAELVNLRDLKGTVPEFSDLDMQTAGLPNATLGRDRKDLFVFKVTDKQSPVPLAERHRFAFSLSIHGIERAGLEGGVRAAEDLVTWAATAPATKILEPTKSGPAAGDVLKNNVLYFLLSNPDGWGRGDVTNGGVFYQRYNGNGIDLNREFPGTGYSNPVYTPFVEPEARGFAAYLQREKNNSKDKRFVGSLDLHGMLARDSFSLTLLSGTAPDWASNAQVVGMSEAIYQDAIRRLKYSKLIADPADCPGDIPVFIVVASGSLPMCPDQWGTVWDTINYQTTGSIGDWMTTEGVGLGAIGVDNEMAFSHLTPNDVFIPELEQLHIDGNKGIIYAQIASQMAPKPVPVLQTKAGFAPSVQRRVRAASTPAPLAPLPAQAAIDLEEVVGMGVEFDVMGPAQGIRNGGLSAHLTYTHVNGISPTNQVPVRLQRYGVEHPGEPVGWYDVGANYLGDTAYMPAGARIDVNRPDPGRYRLAPEPLLRLGVTRMRVTFTAADTIPQPNLPYDVANTDVFAKLDSSVRAISPAAILKSTAALRGVPVYVLADDAAPGVAVGDRPRWFAALKSYVEKGGTLVLTDSALSALADLGVVPPSALRAGVEYGGWISFTDLNGESTFATSPLAASLDRPGASSGEGAGLTLRRQTYDPGAVGYPISEDIGGTCVSTGTCTAPQFVVDADAWKKAGGSVAGRASVTVKATETIGVALGDVPLGRGRIRIAGGLLPTPTQAYNHPYGLDGYGLSWTGWQVLANLLSGGAAVEVGDETLPRTGGTGPEPIDLAMVVIGLSLAVRMARRLRTP